MLHIRLEAFRIDGYVESSFLNLPLHLNVDKFDKLISITYDIADQDNYT